MAKHKTRNQRLGWVLFVLYLLLLIHLMFFSDMDGRSFMGRADAEYKFHPFREIRRYIVHAREIGLYGVFINLFGNIAGFVPFGFTICIISSRCRSRLYYTAIVSYLLSYGIEMAQLLFRAGSCDVDDIILNTTGGILGYVLFRIVQYFRSRHYEKTHRGKSFGGKKETF